jgi:transposase
MKVYRYWCEPLGRSDDAALRQQLRLASDYRRELARLENLARVLIRAVDGAVSEEARPAWRKTEDYRALTHRIRGAHAAAVREARGAIATSRDGDLGLAWGTYLQVEEAADASRRSVPTYQDVRGWSPRDEGRLAVQIQKPRVLSASALLGGVDTRVKISNELYALGSRVDGHRPPAIGISPRNRNGDLRPKRLRTLSIRIGSSANRDPIWAQLHVLMHRPLPDASLKWVFVQRQRVALHYRWEAMFVVDEDDRAASPSNVSAAVGVDLGWRRVADGGIRVAYWLGSDGREGSLVLPEEVVRRAPKSDSLRSIRDRNRDELSLVLRAWLAGVPETSWIREECAHMHAWKRIGRFAVLVGRWRDRRITGDEEIFDRAVAWLKQDRHLYEWEANNRRRMQLQIAGRIEAWAVHLTREYGRVAIEKMDLRKLVRQQHPDDQTWQQQLNAQRVSVVGPGAVRLALKRFAAKAGAAIVEVPAAYTTRDCATCGHRRDDVLDWSPLEIGCSSCDAIEDQDRTAARNLMAHASGPVPLESASVLASTSTSKKLRVRHTRKRAMMEIAREEPGDSATSLG